MGACANFHAGSNQGCCQLVLQEVMLEHRNNPEILKQARADAEEFLHRIREGRTLK